MSNLKQRVRDFWESEPCGTRYGASEDRRTYFEEIAHKRYSIEPYILDFARFEEGRGRRVLEIGVGAGSDFVRWIHAGARAVGTDLTEAGARLARENARLRANGHGSSNGRAEDSGGAGGNGRPHAAPRAQGNGRGQDRNEGEGRAPGPTFVGDAEALPIRENQFELVYSWGVLHHSPDTETALREAHRVLQPGGTFRCMVYHLPSWSGWMLWAQHGLLKGRPLRSPREILASHYESPGTKGYGRDEFREILERIGFVEPVIRTHLSTSDLLLQKRSNRYASSLFRFVWALYPRWLVRALGHRYGTVLMAEARKPGVAKEARESSHAKGSTRAAVPVAEGSNGSSGARPIGNGAPASNGDASPGGSRGRRRTAEPERAPA